MTGSLGIRLPTYIILGIQGMLTQTNIIDQPPPSTLLVHQPATTLVPTSQLQVHATTEKMVTLSDNHKQHARKYFCERQPHAWNRGRFFHYFRPSTALSDTQIGNAFRSTLFEIKMGEDKQQAARARELLLEVS